MSRRYFDTDYWDGRYVRSLSPTENYLYLYLLLNPNTNIAGIFDDQPDIFAFRTRIPIEEVMRILDKFVSDGKIIRFEQKIAITKWGKHQTKSPDVASGIARVLSGISEEGLYTLMGGSGDSVYTLPPGSTVKSMQKLIKSYREANNEEIGGEGVGTVYTGSRDRVIPNLTLPNPTPLSGGGRVSGGGDEPGFAAHSPMVGGGDDPFYDSSENVLGLSEQEIRSLDKPEYENIYLHDEYVKICEKVKNKELKVNNPLKFMQKRIESIYKSLS